MPAPRILSLQALPTALASFLAGILHRTVHERGRASFALAGGSSPRATYAALAAPPLGAVVPWPAVDVFFGDERAVPPDHPHSNYAMAFDSLVEPLGIPTTNVHRMRAEDADLDAAARAYDAILPSRLDLLLLGIGEDGHTASLFPGSPALAESRRVVAAVSPRPPFERLTITPPVIAAAHHVVVLAAGAAKADAVRRALAADADPARVPAALARDGAWFLDTDAAAGLGSTG